VTLVNPRSIISNGHAQLQTACRYTVELSAVDEQFSHICRWSINSTVKCSQIPIRHQDTSIGAIVAACSLRPLSRQGHNPATCHRIAVVRSEHRMAANSVVGSHGQQLISFIIFKSILNTKNTAILYMQSYLTLEVTV
jgi:hypothetical protein